MSRDEVRLLEHRSEAIEQQLRIQRIEIARISDSLRQSDGKIAIVNSQFKQVKAQLLSVSESQAQKNPAQKLAESKVFAQKLSQLSNAMQKELLQAKTLTEKKQSSLQQLAAGMQQIEKLNEHVNSIKRRELYANDEKAHSELEDLTNARDASDRQDSAKVSFPTHAATSLRTGHTPTPLGHGEHMRQTPLDQTSSDIKNAQTPQENSSATNAPAQRTFRDALAAVSQEQISSLEKWEQLDRSGLGFRINLGAEKNIGVEIDSHTTGGISVRLQTENKRGLRQLRNDRQKILAELSNAGCTIKTITVGSSCK